MKERIEQIVQLYINWDRDAVIFMRNESPGLPEAHLDITRIVP